MASQEYGLKRHFNEDAAVLIGTKVRAVRPDFDVDGYAREVAARIPGKELKDRVLVLAEGLRDRLPADYPAAVEVLAAILGAELAEGEGMFNESWFLMPVARFVEEYGHEHPEVSLRALEEITRRHTAEYAVRPYIDKHYDLAMATLADWALSPSHNVRRAASEGCRSRLPWAKTLTRFVKDPRPVLAILEPLRSDSSEYVRKSVANNLNDITKDDRELALATAARWLAESQTPETAWIVKHGLRTLVKKGDQDALRLLGATGGEHIEIPAVRIAPTAIRLGEAVTIRVDLVNGDSTPHSVTVDYVVHHVRLGGKAIPKVFKLATVDLGAGERKTLEKVHKVREIQTRRYYPGDHLVDIQVNGTVLASDRFELRL
ncbi:DNA alkylation repair protein [Actinokineospora cianjurensis]|uniref:3-methyladenine DNA glycosylase AlkC n=1 Tax=Actinokineospora cianjurensis TaxID=585224 RepID=A0A421B0Z5_9PSEU|nr:DNA alkylation repair protein [Actinokineospora cianjurensis]RLK57951.1 3-methyladenine DNA glycosylase AlkC [Actinokineospora cianjurensis]